MRFYSVAAVAKFHFFSLKINWRENKEKLFKRHCQAKLKQPRTVLKESPKMYRSIAKKELSLEN